MNRAIRSALNPRSATIRIGSEDCAVPDTASAARTTPGELPTSSGGRETRRSVCEGTEISCFRRELRRSQSHCGSKTDPHVSRSRLRLCWETLEVWQLTLDVSMEKHHLSSKRFAIVDAVRHVRGTAQFGSPERSWAASCGAGATMNSRSAQKQVGIRSRIPERVVEIHRQPIRAIPTSPVRRCVHAAARRACRLRGWWRACGR